MNVMAIAPLIPALLLLGMLGGQTADSTNVTEEGIMELTSTAFDSGELIPSRYTCDGEDLLPPLGLERCARQRPFANAHRRRP